jgi:hypothetical protein
VSGLRPTSWTPAARGARARDRAQPDHLYRAEGAFTIPGEARSRSLMLREEAEVAGAEALQAATNKRKP